MARRLKVFRTAAGFDDAYVAAPSRKAALAAWGSTADLFARGVAEETTDPALMAEPLARPGEVVKRSRGSAAEQMAALPADRPKRAAAKAAGGRKTAQGRKAAGGKKAGGTAKRRAAARPKPSRGDLDAAERALDDARYRHRAAQDELAERQAALDRAKKALGREQAAERTTLERAKRAAGEAYDAALEEWRG